MNRFRRPWESVCLSHTVMFYWFQWCCLTASLTGFESFTYSNTGGDKGSFCSFSACPHLPAIDKTTSVSRHLLALIWCSDSVKSRVTQATCLLMRCLKLQFSSLKRRCYLVLGFCVAQIFSSYLMSRATEVWIVISQS